MASHMGCLFLLQRRLFTIRILCITKSFILGISQKGQIGLFDVGLECHLLNAMLFAQYRTLYHLVSVLWREFWTGDACAIVHYPRVPRASQGVQLIRCLWIRCFSTVHVTLAIVSCVVHGRRTLLSVYITRCEPCCLSLPETKHITQGFASMWIWIVQSWNTSYARASCMAQERVWPTTSPWWISRRRFWACLPTFLATISLRPIPIIFNMMLRP